MKRKKKDHLSFLCNIGELGSKLSGSPDIDSFLNEITEKIAKHFNADVCSIYIYEEVTQQLVLRANYGLAPENVGHIVYKVETGLLGMSLKRIMPILENRTSLNPLYNPRLKDSMGQYESLLCMPIVNNLEKAGVIVLRAKVKNHFSKSDLVAIRAIASHLAGLIENARVFLALRNKQIIAPTNASNLPKTTKGHGVSCGMAIGSSFIYNPIRLHQITTDLPTGLTLKMTDFKNALDLTVQELKKMQIQIGKRLPEIVSLIFDTQLLMLKDPLFIGEIESAIEKGECPLRVTARIGRKYTEMMSSSPHPYIQEKAQDIEDLVIRLIDNLMNPDQQDACKCSKEIVIAQYLYASDILKLAAEKIKGIILVGGGTTAHISILARSMEIPLIIVTNHNFLKIPDGTSILLDADDNNIIIQPSIEQIKQAKKHHAEKTHLKWTVQAKTFTLDGVQIKLFANVNLLNDVWLAKENLAGGIGLFRTEIPFLIRNAIPNEEEQLNIYEKFVQTIPNTKITIRTFDLGSDKLLAYYDVSEEVNPALGLRSLRFTFKYPKIMEGQLRAILRAGAKNPKLCIMFPMVSSIEDFEHAEQIVKKCISDLKKEGIPCCENPSLGIMVETPAAVEIIDVLAKEVDFMCVGTNDLTQFTLAVDRSNQEVSSYYIPHHPAILRSLKRIVDAGKHFGKTVSICGEMASREEYIPFLLGIGIRILSLDPHHIPKIQQTIASFSICDAEKLAEEMLNESRAENIMNRLKNFLVQNILRDNI